MALLTIGTFSCTVRSTVNTSKLWCTVPAELRLVLACTALSKLVALLIIYMGIQMFHFNSAGYANNFVYPPDESINYETPFKTWDGMQYIAVAERGYAAGEMTNVRYPLYPFLMSVVRLLFGGNTLLAGLLLSVIFSFAAVCLLFTFTEHLFDRKTALAACMLFLAFPMNFYTSLVYPESLFLTLSIGLFYAAYMNRPVAVAVLASLAILSRPQGILVTPVLLLMLMKAMQSGAGGQIRTVLFSLAGACIGFGCYLLIMHVSTGSALSGFAAVHAYAPHHSAGNFINPFAWFYRNFIEIEYSFHLFGTSIIDRLFFCAAVSALILCRRQLDGPLFFYSAAMILVPALADSFSGYPRYLLAVFPIYIALAARMKTRFVCLVIPMIAVQTIFLLAHSLNYWVA